jgi:hypothetical protein
MERVMGIEPTSSAWKAEVLAFELHPQNFLTANLLLKTYLLTNLPTQALHHPIWPTTPEKLVEGGGFEPPKAEPADLQSAPFDRSGTPPN